MFVRHASPHRERGFALFVTLLVLVVVSALVAAFMMLSNVETKVAGHNLRGSQALNIAEAGVAEAMSRIRNGDVPNNANPRMVAQVFLSLPGQVPVLGADSTALATAQPNAQWLQYSTPTPTDKVLTIKYKTDANRTTIYRYDATKNPPIQTLSGLPVFQITATGRKGTDRRKIVTEVMQKPVKVRPLAALAAAVNVDFSGNSDVCGYNHRSDTPPGTKGRPPCSDWEVGSGNLVGGWSTGNIDTAGSATQYGTPATASGQTGFYAGPWESLDMSQTEFVQWIGPPVSTAPDPPRGIIYLDNDNTAQNQSGSFTYHGGDGEGLLYVDGDLTLNGSFNFKGLIYIEGNLKVNGTTWILGSVIVRGTTRIKIAHGDCTILYSENAISESIAKYGGQFVTLSWLETR